MSTISSKLQQLGYRRLIEGDRHEPSELANLEEIVGRPVPSDYLEFLASFPDTGCFEERVVCVGIEACHAAPDRIYPVDFLYASCSQESRGLLANIDPSMGFPDHLLLIGSDVGDNGYWLDLQPESYGKVYYQMHEEPIETAFVLVAESFTSFVDRLTLETD